MNPRLSFEAHACSSQARAAGLGDVTVTIRHIPTSTVFLLSKEDARAFAFRILKATDPELDTWTTLPALVPAVPGVHRLPTTRGRVICADHDGSSIEHAAVEMCSKCGGDAETTRKACSKCLKDCAECQCVEDCIGKGRG